MLALQGISKSFGGITVLSGVSLGLAAGEIGALIGPNGAGKTTLFNIVSGFLRQDAGEVIFMDRPLGTLQPQQRARMGIARTFQLVKPFARMTVAENALVGGLCHRGSVRQARPKGLAALDRVGLMRVKDSAAGALTLIDRKRLELARCLATEPRLLLLDELMTGLNPVELSGMIELIQSLRAEGLTILLVEHIMEAVARLADRIVVLKDGAILAEGRPREILHNAAVVEAYLGEPIAAA
jgi:branched-chain amino acid transport system ATP-binding protein